MYSLHRTGSGNDASPNSIGLIIRGRGWVHVINAGGEKLNRWMSVEYRCVECGSEQGMVAQNHFVVEDVVGGSFERFWRVLTSRVLNGVQSLQSG